MTPDLERLFQAAPYCDLILTPDLRIAAVTDAYLRATMTEREQIVGRGIFEVFPDNPEDPTARGETNLRASLAQVLATKAPHQMAVQRYDVRRPASAGGDFEVRYWSPLNSPILDERGEVEVIVHHVEDVTENVQRDAHLLDARQANERLRMFIEYAPASLAMLDRDLRYLHVSARWRADYRLGEQDLVGRSHYDLFPQLPEAWRAVHQRALAGEVVTADPNGERFVRADGTEQWLSWVVRPWRDGDGVVQGIVIFAEDLTERKRLEALLLERERAGALRAQTEQSEQQYRDLMEAAPDAMLVVGADGRIQMVNAQAERVFGFGRDELVGAPLAQLVPEAARSAHDQHVARFFAEPRARSMASFSIELTALRKDGTSLPVEVSLGPVRHRDGLSVCAAVRDISDRRRLAASAALVAQRLTSAVESMVDPFALFDGEDRLVLCNKAFRRLLLLGRSEGLAGKTAGEVVELFARQLDFPDEAARQRYFAERFARFAALRDGASSQASEVTTRTGRRLRFLSQRTFEGGVVVTVWDLTVEEQRNEELRRAHALAAAGSAAKTEFLSSMSHELRTPLNAVLGFAELLDRDKKQPLTERQRERVKRILNGGEQLLHLVDDVLDLARIEGGRIAITLAPASLAEMVDEVKRTLEPMQAKVGIEIDIQPVLTHPSTVLVDRMRYVQILLNFCSNALKYNRPGGSVRITAEQATPTRVRVSVTDTGIGIPEAKRTLLFQPFQRAGQETGPIEGTGIGLVIAQKLAGAMSGQVGFESKEGEGSSFWVEVPAV